MVKFESLTIVQRKLETELDKNSPKKKDCFITMLQRFCESGTAGNRERSRRLSKISEEEIDKVHHVTENKKQTSVRTVATTCSISRTTAHQIINLNLNEKHF